MARRSTRYLHIFADTLGNALPGSINDIGLALEDADVDPAGAPSHPSRIAIGDMHAGSVHFDRRIDPTLTGVRFLECYNIGGHRRMSSNRGQHGCDDTIDLAEMLATVGRVDTLADCGEYPDHWSFAAAGFRDGVAFCDVFHLADHADIDGADALRTWINNICDRALPIEQRAAA